MSLEIDISDLPNIYSTTPIADIGYPRKPVPAMHISGCNLRCPYCINNKMIRGRNQGDVNARETVLRYAKDKEPMVLVSGGEAIFNSKTINLLAFMKECGIKPALATNGTHPHILRDLVEEGLVSHVVMDIKTALIHDRYAAVSGMTAFDRCLDNILESIDILKGKYISSEFRTTMCSLYVGREDVIEIAKFLGPEAIYVLQYYTTHQTLKPHVANPDYVISYEKLVDIAEEISQYVRRAIVSEV